MQSPSFNFISEQQWQTLLDDQVVVWDAFLSAIDAHELCATAHHLDQQNLFVPAAIGAGQSRHHEAQIRSDSIYWLNPETLTEPSFQKIFARLDELRQEFNQKLYLGLTHLECHLAHYAPGQGYQEHIDQPKKQNLKQNPLQGERKISFVLYLNPQWQKGDGGEFVYKDLHENAVTIEPLFNRLVFFRSDTVPHSVAFANKDRWSLTGWMRRS